MKKLLVILFCILFISSSFSQTENQLSDNFKKIIEIDENNNRLINENFNDLSYKEYFYYYILVSEELIHLDKYNEWFEKTDINIDAKIKKIFKNKNFNNLKIEKKKLFTEELLKILHEEIFIKYKLNANRLSEIIDKGEFNCVSSSIMYGIFLKKYNINYVGVETKDHAFIKIIFNDDVEIDVETTNKFGFEPGKKKEVLDSFGETTGFTYVPQKNYNDRIDISYKKLLLLIYKNLINDYYNNKKYIKSANLGYIIFKALNDNTQINDFKIHFNNYLAQLSKKKKYLEIIDDINSYLLHFGLDEIFLELRFNTIGNFINTWNDYDKIEEIKDFLLIQNNKFIEIKDNNNFINIYLLFIYKSINNYNNNNLYEKSYSLFNDTTKLYQNDEIIKIFENILISQLKFYNKNKEFNKCNSEFNNRKNNFPQYSDLINKYIKINYLNKLNHLVSIEDYSAALNEGLLLNSRYENDKDFILFLKNIYINYTIFLYKQNDLNNVIKYCDEGLSKFPDNKTLKNNYLSFFINFINKEINKKEYNNAENILITAKEKFPNNSKLKKLEEYLNSRLN